MQPHWLQYAKLPWPSLSHGVTSESCPLSQWCHPTILSFAALFFYCLQSFPASGSVPVGWLFPSGDQSIGASASASVLPENIQVWFPLRLTCLIFLQSRGLSAVFSSTIIQRHLFFSTQSSLIVHLSHSYMTTGKTIALTIWTFVSKLMSLLCNIV